MTLNELMEHLDERIDEFREEWERGGDMYVQGYADGMDYVYTILYDSCKEEETKGNEQ